MKLYKNIFLLTLFFPSIIAFLHKPSTTLFLIIFSQLYFFIPFFYKSKISLKKKKITSNKTTFCAILLFYFIVDLSHIIQIFSNLIEGKYFEYGLELALKRYEGDGHSLQNKIRILAFFTLSWLLPTVKLKKPYKVTIYILFFIIESSELARAGVVLSLVSIFTVYSFNNKEYFNRIKFKVFLKNSFYLIFAGLIIFFISAYGRVYNDNNAGEIIINKIGEYTFASYEALSNWAYNHSFEQPSLGSSSFGIIKKIKGDDKIIGAYAPTQTSFGTTNLYTVNRPLFEDFSVLLALFWLYIGISIKKLFYSTQLSKLNFTIYFFALPIILYPFYSPFYFNNYTLSYFLFCFLIRIK